MMQLAIYENFKIVPLWESNSSTISGSRRPYNNGYQIFFQMHLHIRLLFGLCACVWN